MARLRRVSDNLGLAVALNGLATLDQDKVVVVCTIAQGCHDSEFEPGAIADELPDDVEVVVVPPHLTPALRKQIGGDLAVSHGAARVYPIRTQDAHYIAMNYLPGQRSAVEQRRLIVAEATKAWKTANPSQDVSTRFAPSSAPAPPPEARPAPKIPRDPIPSSQGATLLDAAEVRRFAEHLLSPARTKPAVLISRPAGRPTAMVDSAHIAKELEGLAEVYEIATGAASWALADALASYPGMEVYGGAVRTYPPGTEWTRDPRRSPLRFILSEHDAAWATEQLIADASSMAFAGGYRTQRSVDTRTASGVVSGIVSGRALVRLDGGGIATILPELTVAGVDAGHLFAPGMRVTGLLDLRLGRLDISEAVRPSTRLVAHYATGDQVLVRVLVVEPDLCVVELVPGLQADLYAESILDTTLHVDLRQWLTPGEVLTVVVAEIGTSGDEWRLSLLDVDRLRPTVPAPSLLEGGPAWLTSSEPAGEADSFSTSAEVEPAAVPSSPRAEPEVEEPRTADRSEFEALRAERDSLAADLSRLRRTLTLKDDELRSRRARARETSNEVSKLRRMLASSEEAVRAYETDRAAFVDPEQQLDYELRLAWARRIPASEKKALPLVDYILGPEFLETLNNVQGIDRGKVTDVLVDVLTGRVHQLHSRATHQLRTGTGGSDPFVARSDGATCWRVSLQHKTPQARRLHYWQLNDGTIELSSIRLHDDFRP